MRIFVTCILIYLSIAILSIIFIDDKDICLDSGVCKEGLTIIDGDTGIEFTVNKQTCNEFKGDWKAKYNFCHFKY